MSGPGEIITFQVGTYANHVGAHLFNLQDPNQHPEHEKDFASKAMWKESLNPQRQRVLTPRVLMFDLKDKWPNTFLKSAEDVVVPAQKAPAQASAQAPATLDKIEKGISWDGRVHRVVEQGSSDSNDDEDDKESSQRKAGVKKKVKLGDLSKNGSNWGDYIRWRAHDTRNTAFRIPNFMYNASSDQLVSYGQGLDVYHNVEDEVVDGIRHFAEDCDHLEGFQMLVDENNGFTGICGGILEHLGDEYDKKACLGLGLNRPLAGGGGGEEFPSSPVMKDYKIRISNTALLWSSFSRHSRVFSSFGVCRDIFSLNPVAKQFNGIVDDCSSPYISSAVLAATLDTLTGPYRLHSPTFPLHEMTSLLNAFGHKMTSISFSLPFSLVQPSLFSTLNENGLSSLSSLTPNVELKLEESIGNLFVVRGIQPEQVMSKSELREYKHVDIKTVTSCLELYCRETYSKSVHVIKDISPRFKSSFPFPTLYERGYLNEHSFERKFSHTQGDCWFLPAMASAQNTPAVGHLLEKMLQITGGGVGGSAVKIKSFYEPSSATCNSTVIEFDDYIECLNDLSTLRETYHKD